MRCRKARWYLSARCDDTLSERQRQRLNGHLEACADCRREAFYFSENAAASTRVERVAVRPDFNLRLRAAVRRAEAEAAAPTGWHAWLTGLSLRPAFAVASAAAIILAGIGAYQFSDFSRDRAALAENTQRAEQGRLARAQAMGLSEAEPILPAGWTAVDGLSPEMQRLQEQYLAGENLPRNYIVQSEGLDDPLSNKPRPLYVMPTVPSEQMVREVSY
ncbi:MAG TPA: zf-HC2 domain-containing protein [Acidobacteriota bacterium]|nr:zf-HC2 domain-containing protein [Acidobacteriota bacterium]